MHVQCPTNSVIGMGLMQGLFSASLSEIQLSVLFICHLLPFSVRVPLVIISLISHTVCHQYIFSQPRSLPLSKFLTPYYYHNHLLHLVSEKSESCAIGIY